MADRGKAHFGIITPPVSGHLHPFSALGRELQERGHRVTCFQMPDLEDKIRAEGIDFPAYRGKRPSAGSLPRSLAQLGRLHGLGALRFTIRAVAQTSVMVCRDAPAAIRSAGVEALLVDQMEPAGAAVAEHLQLPFITICNALAMNREPLVPPPFTPWNYEEAGWAKLREWDWLRGIGLDDAARGQGGGRVSCELEVAAGPFSRRVVLETRSDLPDAARVRSSARAASQMFSLRRTLATGRPRYPWAFPWDRLDGRPLVYASLGTLQNSREAVFRRIAEACQEMQIQLVISHGGGLSGAPGTGPAGRSPRG